MKTLLVLEGGAFRGTYTAAIIDKFIEDGINIDAIIGVSAGALIAPNYYSRQIGRCLNINRKFIIYFLHLNYTVMRQLYIACRH